MLILFLIKMIMVNYQELIHNYVPEWNSDSIYIYYSEYEKVMVVNEIDVGFPMWMYEYIQSPKYLKPNIINKNKMNSYMLPPLIDDTLGHLSIFHDIPWVTKCKKDARTPSHDRWYLYYNDVFIGAVGQKRKW